MGSLISSQPSSHPNRVPSARHRHVLAVCLRSPHGHHLGTAPPGRLRPPPQSLRCAADVHCSLTTARLRLQVACMIVSSAST